MKNYHKPRKGPKKLKNTDAIRNRKKQRKNGIETAIVSEPPKKEKHLKPLNVYPWTHKEIQEMLPMYPRSPNGFHRVTEDPVIRQVTISEIIRYGFVPLRPEAYQEEEYEIICRNGNDYPKSLRTMSSLFAQTIPGIRPSREGCTPTFYNMIIYGDKKGVRHAFIGSWDVQEGADLDRYSLQRLLSSNAFILKMDGLERCLRSGEPFGISFREKHTPTHPYKFQIVPVHELEQYISATED